MLDKIKNSGLAELDNSISDAVGRGMQGLGNILGNFRTDTKAETNAKLQHLKDIGLDASGIEKEVLRRRAVLEAAKKQRETEADARAAQEVDKTRGREDISSNPYTGQRAKMSAVKKVIGGLVDGFMGLFGEKNVFTAAPGDVPDGKNPEVMYKLDYRGDGWTNFGAEDEYMYAAKPMALLLSGLINDWKDRHPDSPIAINDMSLPGGGPNPDHKTHRFGLDVDIKFQYKDGQGEYDANGKAKSGTYNGTDNYSAEKTIEMIETLMDNVPEGYEIQSILFNDRKVRDYFENYRNSNNRKIVRPKEKHDDHLHIELRKI